MIATIASADRFLADADDNSSKVALKDYTKYDKDSKSCLTCLLGDGVFCDNGGKVELNSCLEPKDKATCKKSLV